MNLSHSQSAQERGPAFAYMAAMVILGTVGVFVEQAGLATITIVFFRCLFGALALAAFCLGKGLFIRENFSARNLGLAVAGGLLMVVNWIAFFESIRRTGIAVATIVFHVQPFMLLVLSAMLFRERIAAHKLGWIAIGFTGLVLATGLHPAGLAADGAYLVGIACTLLAALAYSGVTLTTRAMRGMWPHLTALIHCTVGALVLAAWITLPASGMRLAQWGWLVGLGLFPTALAYVLIYGALPKLKTASIAASAFIYPAAAVGFDYFIYGRVLGPVQIGGVILIVLASLGVNLNWHWHRAGAAQA